MGVENVTPSPPLGVSFLGRRTPRPGHQQPDRATRLRPRERPCYAPHVSNTPSHVYEGHRVDGHTVTVTCDGIPLDPRPELRAASAAGSESGDAEPAQLALAILAHALGDDELALAHHQTFHFDVIAKMTESSWRITQSEVRTWIADLLAKNEAEPTMDPTATLRELLDALRNHDRPTTFDRLESLLDLLSRGGTFPDVPEPPTDESHQGWTNHQTWAVHLWINNEEGTWNYCRDMAREAVEDAEECDQVNDGIWTQNEARRFMLADRLKGYLAESNPLNDNPSLYSDLLGSALEDINYDELADAFLEDLEP